MRDIYNYIRRMTFITEILTMHEIVAQIAGYGENIFFLTKK